ncbi:hypothetical protein T02_9236 [Trichinella nativa]|uniref:Uncharacterized protein n=1 Tax=Trichinella nativa TaxID=6335 RepID=A0A0V1L219_9BILA|nr:hypothetical protein T02_9236 [Trichinella nativa]
MDFRKYLATAEFLAEVVQKIIILVDVVETLMLFQERYVITIVCRGVAQLILDNEMIHQQHNQRSAATDIQEMEQLWHFGEGIIQNLMLRSTFLAF